VGNAADLQQYGAKEPFIPKEQRRRLPRAEDKDVVRAPADTSFPQNVPWVGKLQPFWISRSLRTLIEENPIGEAIHQLKKRGFIPRDLSYGDYSKWWTLLLQLERIQDE